MGYMSPWHWMLVVLVLVLLFGAKRIPDIAKGLGQGIKEFKKAAREAEQEHPATPPPEKKPDKLEKKDDAGA